MEQRPVGGTAQPDPQERHGPDKGPESAAAAAVLPAAPSAGSRSPSPETRGCDLFVGNVPYTLSEAEVSELFRRFGRVSKECLLKDKRTGYRKGCAFVSYETYEEARNAHHELKRLDLEGRRLRVDWDRGLAVKQQQWKEETDMKAQRRSQYAAAAAAAAHSSRYYGYHDHEHHRHRSRSHSHHGHHHHHSERSDVNGNENEGGNDGDCHRGSSSSSHRHHHSRHSHHSSHQSRSERRSHSHRRGSTSREGEGELGCRGGRSRSPRSCSASPRSFSSSASPLSSASSRSRSPHHKPSSPPLSPSSSHSSSSSSSSASHSPSSLAQTIEIPDY